MSTKMVCLSSTQKRNCEADVKLEKEEFVLSFFWTYVCITFYSKLSSFCQLIDWKHVVVYCSINIANFTKTQP